MIDPMT